MRSGVGLLVRPGVGLLVRSGVDRSRGVGGVGGEGAFGLDTLEADGVPPPLDELLAVLEFSVVLPLVDEPALLVLVVLLLGQHHQGLGDLVHVELIGFDQFEEGVFGFAAVLLAVELHGRPQQEGVEVLAEGEVMLEYAFADEAAVEEHFEKIVGVVVVEDDPFSESSRVVAQVVDGTLP